MENYSNQSGNSPITHYQIEDDRIIVWFKTGKSYTYSYRKAGRNNVEQMKKLAIIGKGLCAYITRNVRERYDK